jgi:hypothetical protein
MNESVKIYGPPVTIERGGDGSSEHSSKNMLEFRFL